MKKKIAWITGSNFFNVDEPLIKPLCQHFEITWVILIPKREKEKDEIYQKFKDKKVKGWIQELDRFRSLKNILVYIKTIKRLKKTSPDLYYIDFLGLPYFFPLLRFAHIKHHKLIYACHDFIDHVNIKNRKLISTYKKFIFNTVGNVKLFSKNQYKLFKATYPDNKTFYSPLCLQDYGNPLRERENTGIIRFLFFGLIRENKGLDILIKAANKLYETYPKQFIVSIFGKANDWEQYDKLIIHKECFDLKIQRINNAEIPNLFNSADFLVLPYRDVTQSGPLSIAYCYNIPVIASDHDGFREFIEDKKTGFLFKDGDVDELYRVMSNIIEKQIDYNRMKYLQKQFTDENLSLNKIVNRYKDMFNDLCIKQNCKYEI